MPPIDEDPYFANFDDLHSVLFVDFDDGMQVAFHPHPLPASSPRLTQVQLRFGVTGQQYARYNVHGSDGGGKFTLISGDEHREQLGVHWELAYALLQPRPFESPKRQRAWSYVSRSLVFAQRLQQPAATGLF